MAMEATDTMATMARGRLRLPLMPSLAMDMVMDMAMARGRLRLPLLLSLAMDMVMDMVMDMAMDMVMVTDMAMEAMDIMDTMARGRLRLPLLLVMDMAMEAMDITDTMARGLLMLSPDMDTMVMDMAAMDTMATVTDMAMATTDKFLVKSFQSSVQREF